MAHDIINTTPSADVDTDDTVVFNYPDGRSDSDYDSGTPAVLWSEGLETLMTEGEDEFTIVYGGSAATVTYKGATTIPAGSRLSLQLPLVSVSDEVDFATVSSLTGDWKGTGSSSLVAALTDLETRLDALENA